MENAQPSDDAQEIITIVYSIITHTGMHNHDKMADDHLLTGWDVRR